MAMPDDVTSARHCRNDWIYKVLAARTCGKALPLPFGQPVLDQNVQMTTPPLRIALYQPDIPGNTGTILRMAACLGLAVDIIEPAGFDMSDRALKRAGMDYLEMAALTRHVSWDAFREWQMAEGRRLLLFTTKSSTPYTSFAFREGDILLFGRESAGVPDIVHQVVDAQLNITMRPGARSLNLAICTAMAAGEALRQVSPQWAIGGS